MTRAGALLVLSVGLAMSPVSSVRAVDLQVEGSEGTTEALIPGLGWRRAVLGRTLPPDSVVTTWIGSSVTISAEGIVIEIAPLTYLRLEDGPTPGFSLSAGRVTVQSEHAFTVRVPIRDVTVKSSGPVRLVLTTLDVVVERGEVSLVFSDGGDSTTVAADQSVSLIPHDLVPIIPTP